MADRYLITCEHGGNRIPPHYRSLFLDYETLLASHRGYDPGALAMARDLARALDAPLHVSTTSRLLIDLNRSPGHPRLYSEATEFTSNAERRAIFERYYLPYRRRAEAEIGSLIAAGHRVIHISSHSFTPVLDGEVRNADIGLLYDPARGGEVAFCCQWQAALAALASDLKVRRNYPYTGKSDGFTAYLRRKFPAEAYVGIELEINQKHADKRNRHWLVIRELVVEALAQALTHK